MAKQSHKAQLGADGASLKNDHQKAPQYFYGRKLINHKW